MIIIVKKSKPRGLTRTHTDAQLVAEGWGSSFKNEEDADKCAYIERQLKEDLGADNSRVTAPLINRVR